MKTLLQKLKNLVFTFIGVDKKAIYSCLPVTQSLYISLSMVFMAVITYATIMMVLTMATISDSIYIIIICSLIYFLFVAGLERIIINKSFGAFGFCMRIFLAILIATAVSIPAEMWVFRKEIDFEIAKNESDRVKSSIQEIYGYKNSINTKIMDYRNTIKENNHEIERLLKEEETEKIKSNIPFKKFYSDGSYSIAYKFVPTTRLRQIQQLMPQKKKMLADIMNEYENERKYLLQSNNDYTSFIEKSIKSDESPITFVSRYQIMRTLQEKNKYYNQIGWGIMLFFFSIEIMVLVLKSIISKNEYEKLQEYLSLKRIAGLQLKSYELNAQLHKNEVKSIIRTDIQNLIRPLIHSSKKNGKNHFNPTEV